MKDTSGPAFAAGGSQGAWQTGMTLRQYYAGQAMKAFISLGEEVLLSSGGFGRGDSAYAYASVRYADALLSELEKE